jgi:hypothetical protein
LTMRIRDLLLALVIGISLAWAYSTWLINP